MSSICSHYYGLCVCESWNECIYNIFRGKSNQTIVLSSEHILTMWFDTNNSYQYFKLSFDTMDNTYDNTLPQLHCWDKDASTCNLDQWNQKYDLKYLSDSGELFKVMIYLSTRWNLWHSCLSLSTSILLHDQGL